MRRKRLRRTFNDHNFTLLLAQRFVALCEMRQTTRTKAMPAPICTQRNLPMTHTHVHPRGLVTRAPSTPLQWRRCPWTRPTPTVSALSCFPEFRRCTPSEAAPQRLVASTHNNRQRPCVRATKGSTQGVGGVKKNKVPATLAPPYAAWCNAVHPEGDLPSATGRVVFTNDG